MVDVTGIEPATAWLQTVTRNHSKALNRRRIAIQLPPLCGLHNGLRISIWTRSRTVLTMGPEFLKRNSGLSHLRSTRCHVNFASARSFPHVPVFHSLWALPRVLVLRF